MSKTFWNRLSLVGLLLAFLSSASRQIYAATYDRSDYGQQIAGIQGDADIWWCDATRKVSPFRPLPREKSTTAKLFAAKNDHEAIQIILRPKKGLRRLTVEIDALNHSSGTVIPRENVKILYVYYHSTRMTSDWTCSLGEYPDALPPLDKPLDLQPNRNQPFWVLIYVPNNAKAGDYKGRLTFKAEGWSAVVPIELHVWNFSLPKENHIDTAFGFGVRNIFRYQQLTSEVDKRQVIDSYLQNFADHRISPYDPAPLDPIQVKFVPDANPPRAEVDFSAFDAAMTKVVDKYHFTTFRLPIKGLGSGSFQGRHEGNINGFGIETPQYQAMFSSYVKQIESHLREKGWLKMAYIYWFDEPGENDYAFVRTRCEMLKKYAPSLQMMLTEQFEESLAGPIDIWCPISFSYNHDKAQERKSKGERFWWYVCTAPRGPYCTLFLDHPATDLRVWLWQTWQRNITGILIWQTTYWNSHKDSAQNPYEDPMSYISGSLPQEHWDYRTFLGYWGNGDGRFLYPPLAAAAPGISGSKPILDAPVSSIRWEMLREGIEDYEYLWLLRDLIAKHRASLTPEQIKAFESLLEVPKDITSTTTTFTTDPAPIYARRAAVAEAIEKLSKQHSSIMQLITITSFQSCTLILVPKTPAWEPLSTST